jgi:CxxC-x17-CxxC domain-containing protein
MAFKKHDFGGGRGDFNRGPRPFQPRGFGQQGDKQRFEAICADCGNRCEVPFRPNGKKPVYCKDCFPKHQDEERGQRDFARPQRFDREAPRSFDRREAPRQFERREAPRPMQPDTRIDALIREVSMLGTKLDMLAGAIAKMSAPEVAEKAATPAKTLPAAKAPKAKKVAKKARK